MNEMKMAGSLDEGKTAVIGFDKRRLSQLVRAAAGNRTISEYSADSGLNRGLIGKIINEKIEQPPTRNSLYKLANPITAKPQNGVQVDELLSAAGYEKENTKIEKKDGGMKLQDAIATSFVPSPTQALSMFLDMLINSGSINNKRNIDISMRGAWFSVKDVETSDRFTVVPAFCEDVSGVEIMKLAIKAMLLDTISTEELVSDLPQRIYFVLVDREDLYDFAKHLPKIGSRSMAVIKATESHSGFEKGVWIKGVDDLETWNSETPITNYEN